MNHSSFVDSIFVSDVPKLRQWKDEGNECAWRVAEGGLAARRELRLYLHIYKKQPGRRLGWLADPYQIAGALGLLWLNRT